MKTAAVMTLAITLALPMMERTIVRAYLHVAGLTGPHGVAGTCALDTHTVARTIDMGIPAKSDARDIIESILSSNDAVPP